MQNKHLGKGSVEWIDAREITLELEEFDRALKDSDGISLLIFKETYGEIYKLKNAYVIVMEESSDGTKECTVVPDTWILSVNTNGKRKEGKKSN